MFPRMPQVACLAPICLFLASVPLAAQFPRVAYELQEGSRVIDECVTCLRPTIEAPLTGSFVLQRLAVKIIGELHELSALELACSDCPESLEYSLRGGGNIHFPGDGTQTGHLDLTLNGVGGVLLEGSAGVSAPWPIIDITMSEDGTRDGDQKLTLRIIAAPRVELTPYELVKGTLADRNGSFLEVICPVCRIANPFVPLEGTLLVGLVDPVDDGFTTYRLDQIHLMDLLPAADFTVLGSGSYQEGGDAKTVKQARLTLTINDSELRVFEGEPVPVEAGGAFPVLDFEVEEVVKNNLWYRLHLVARAAGAVTFRRGDANADGRVDIADAVYHLSWQFTGGPAPTCLEAADSDGDGLHNLTDAIFTLQYLFRSGAAPPAPGPEDCGLAPAPAFSCGSYPVCPVP